MPCLLVLFRRAIDGQQDMTRSVITKWTLQPDQFDYEKLETILRTSAFQGIAKTDICTIESPYEGDSENTEHSHV